jgi:putative inorganic carbon (HCO3(-)) transporter
MVRLRDHLAMHILLAILIGTAVGYALSAGITISTRWTTYLLIVPFAFTFVFAIRSPVLQVSALLIPLLVLENSLISFRRIGPLVVGISLPILIVLYLSWFRRGHRLPPLGGMLRAWLLFLSITLFSSLANLDDFATEFFFFQTLYLEGFFYFLLPLLAFRNLEDLRHVGWVLLGVALLFAGFQAFFLQTGIPILQPTFDVSHAQEWRYGGPLGNPNSLADFYAMLIPTLLVLLVVEQSGLRRAILLAIGAALVGAIILTGSRGGMLAGFAGAVGTVLFLRAQGKKRLFAIPIILLMGVGGYLLVESIFGEYLVLTVERMDRAMEDVRFEIWSVTLDIIADNPLGIGLSPEHYIEQVSRHRAGFFFASPHNLYLGLAANIGIPGLLAFLLLVFAAIWRGLVALNQSTNPREFQLLLLPMGMVLVFLVGAFTEPIYANGHKLNHLFWFAVGTLVWGHQLVMRQQLARTAREADVPEPIEMQRPQISDGPDTEGR